MTKKLDIKIYPYSTVSEDKYIFNHKIKEVLFLNCQKLYSKHFSSKEYPKEEVEAKLTQLLQTVSVEKTIRITMDSLNVFDWQSFISALKEIYPQIIWTSGQVMDEEGYKVYEFHFIPIAIRQVGFPFSIHLKDSLSQQLFQGAKEADWIKELLKVVSRYLIEPSSTSTEDLSESEEVTDFSKKVEKEKNIEITPKFVVNTMGTPSTEPNIEPNIEPNTEPNTELNTELNTEPSTVEEKGTENSHLVEENQELRLQLERLKDQLNHKKILESSTTSETKETPRLNSENNTSYETTISELEKQQVYYETELKQLKDARVRMQLTNDKLNHFIAHLERQMMSSSLDVLEGEPPYVERTKDWYKKRRIPLIEYDRLYQKAKYLEHTWHLNQRLLSMSEQLAFSQVDFSYDFGRINDIRDSAKDIELFVMMDECRVINNRVKIHKGFLWRAPSVTILKNDYENLVEKAAYFDVIQAENQMLERMIKEHKVKDVTEEAELLEFEKND